MFKKIKSWFGIEEKPQLEDNSYSKPEVKEEVKEEIGFCMFCKTSIMPEEHFRVLNNDKFHKRCFKRMKKAMLEGENIDQFLKGGNDGGK